MEHFYNKKHVQISVSAATALGILFGLWFGKRSEVAGFLEWLVVWLTFIISATVIFSRIDEKYLPKAQDDDR